MKPERPSSERWAVDAVGDGVAVLVLVDGNEEVVVSEVAVQLLDDRAEPGAVLDVPLGEVGEPVWERAVRVATVDHEDTPEDEES